MAADFMQHMGFDQTSTPWVAHRHPRGTGLVEAHVLHEVSRHGFPLLGAQALAGG
ncbi:hypothetical protein, partial [Aeromonas caviae]|uniref:hypothetical protein n=1 Tax=Aeromonas caviae TaxID=648 RepID=UPI0035A24ADB